MSSKLTAKASKDELIAYAQSLEKELDDARKEIVWLRQSIFGSEKTAKLEEEIATLKARLLKSVDKIADLDLELERLTQKDTA